MAEQEQSGAREARTRSFQDVLQQQQQFISHIQALQDEVGGQLAEKEKELAGREEALARVGGELEAKVEERGGLEEAWLQWAVERQGIRDKNGLHEHDEQVPLS